MGSYFQVPNLEIFDQGMRVNGIVWRVVEIRPSGWIRLQEDGDLHREMWVNLNATPALIPVWLVPIQ